MCLFTRASGENRTQPGRFADVNWGSRPFEFGVEKGMEKRAKMGRRCGKGRERWGEVEEREERPTCCCGCRLTTRVSDSVVVAVADIFLFIFLSVAIRLAKCGVGSALRSAEPEPRSWTGTNRLSANPGASVHFAFSQKKVSHSPSEPAVRRRTGIKA